MPGKTTAPPQRGAIRDPKVTRRVGIAESPGSGPEAPRPTPTAAPKTNTDNQAAKSHCRPPPGPRRTMSWTLRPSGESNKSTDVSVNLRLPFRSRSAPPHLARGQVRLHDIRIQVHSIP